MCATYLFISCKFLDFNFLWSFTVYSELYSCNIVHEQHNEALYKYSLHLYLPALHVEPQRTSRYPVVLFLGIRDPADPCRRAGQPLWRQDPHHHLYQRQLTVISRYAMWSCYSKHSFHLISSFLDFRLSRNNGLQKIDNPFFRVNGS